MAEHVWTVRTALDWTRGYLADKGDEHPRRSAEWLLSAATGLSRVELYAYHDRPLAPEERATLREAVKRRAAGEPLQYVTGEVAFRHIVVKVRPGVLIPRPETEVLTGEVLAAIRPLLAPKVADVCTGSGCVGLAIAHEHPTAEVWACDISPVSTATAVGNAERLGLDDRVHVSQGDLLGALPSELRGALDAIVSNPPYIPTADMPDLPAEVAGFEPHLALDGGEDGLDIYRRLLCDATQWLTAGRFPRCRTR